LQRHLGQGLGSQRMSRPDRPRLAAIAAVLAVALVVLLPSAAWAACNPGRPNAGAGAAWQSGGYAFSVVPWGVRGDIEGYDPYLPYLSNGAKSLVTVMLADLTHPPTTPNSWVQPGWGDSLNTPGNPDGRRSYVQFWNPSQGVQRNYFFYQLFSGPDPIPDLNEFARYAALVTYDPTNDPFTVRYRYDIKLAGVGYAPLFARFFPDSVQAFGEILNQAAQFPGDVANIVKIKNAEWMESDGTWRNVPVEWTESGQPNEIGWSHPAGGTFGMWDKRCPT